MMRTRTVAHRTNDRTPSSIIDQSFHQCPAWAWCKRKRLRLLPLKRARGLQRLELLSAQRALDVHAGMGTKAAEDQVRECEPGRICKEALGRAEHHRNDTV
jgi:hypothetical protein